MIEFDAIYFIHLDSGSVQKIPISSITGKEKLLEQKARFLVDFSYESAELETGSIFCIYKVVDSKRVPVLTCGCSDHNHHYKEIWQPLVEVYLQPKIDIPPLPYIAVRWEYSSLLKDEEYKSLSVFAFVLGSFLLLYD